MKISVIVPVYNVEPYLEACLDSILNQTHRDLEVIVINDGSCDRTGSILDKYAAADPRIVAIHQENAGLIAVREKGISLATGEYIGFVDGDDTIAPDMYERLLCNALTYNAEISHCGMLYCFGDGRRKPMHGTGELEVFENTEGVRELLRGNRIEPSLCNKIYAAKLLKDSCLDSTILNNEDLLRNFVLFSRANRSVFEDFCGYLYWRRENSMSNNSYSARIARDVLKARHLILENVPDALYQDAYGCYLAALISAYNGQIGIKNDEARELRRQCHAEITERKSKLFVLDKGRRYRAIAIIAVPGLYGILFRIHMKMLYRRIRKAAERS